MYSQYKHLSYRMAVNIYEVKTKIARKSNIVKIREWLLKRESEWNNRMTENRTVKIARGNLSMTRKEFALLGKDGLTISCEPMKQTGFPAYKEYYIFGNM